MQKVVYTLLNDCEPVYSYTLRAFKSDFSAPKTGQIALNWLQTFCPPYGFLQLRSVYHRILAGVNLVSIYNIIC